MSINIDMKERATGAIWTIVYLVVFIGPFTAAAGIAEATFLRIDPPYAITNFLLKYLLLYPLPFAALLGFLAGSTDRLVEWCLAAAMGVVALFAILHASVITGAIITAFSHYVAGADWPIALWTGVGFSLLTAVSYIVLLLWLGDEAHEYFSVAFWRGGRWAMAFATVGVLAAFFYSKYTTGTYSVSMPLFIRIMGGFAFFGLVVGAISGCRNISWVQGEIKEDDERRERRKDAEKYLGTMTESERTKWVHGMAIKREEKYWTNREE